ncbi:MAG: hypothetical protein JNM55_20905 [Anaerolineales bacterium]|nr:hypothetical protein [Anaerolineales bacterium]
MWSNTMEGKKLVSEISKSVVIETAPEELDIFDELLDDYSEDSNPGTNGHVRDNPLSSGLDERIVAITTIVIAMVKAILDFLTTESIKVVEAEGAEIVKKRIRDLLGRNKKNDRELSGEEKSTFEKDQLNQIKKVAIKRAVQFGISRDKAEKLALAIIGTLTLD